MMCIIERLEGLLGTGGCISGADVALRAEGWASAASCRAMAIVRPKDTQQVSAVLSLCHQARVEVVPYGGGTGLVQGAVAGPGQILLSLERMNRIVEIDPVARTAVVEAGVTLQAVQEAVERQELFFPLDLGARGSATVGGAIATNAGGNRVIRFGRMRERVLGLEVVLPDGEIVSSMNRMIKNNSGYDLKQLFIGAEGTLGVVTRAVLRLRETCAGQSVALIPVQRFEDVLYLFKTVDRALTGALSAFEVMWGEFYEIVTTAQAGTPPLPRGSGHYVLVEAMGSGGAAALEAALATLIEEGRIEDAVVAASQAQSDAIWAIRDGVEALMPLGPLFMFDVSLPIPRMETYVAEVRAALAARWPESVCVVWGHLGDSNLHIWLTVHDAGEAARKAVSAMVYAPLAAAEGTISAEHGIGEEKRDYLGLTRSAGEIALMRRLKALIDPHGIMNPGKILTVPEDIQTSATARTANR
jgi:FAD/FMN-containing dehydrogenase